ncbi:MAG TPA: universal stress protein [Thermodesulfobacteriota bacterium]|jgi:nucleotide-binding universal stress UspA family protein|nr:universal stress protein [Thermodesulfobacteriota bacterium]
MEIRKILWAFDGSKESEEALNYAVFFAKRFDSEIIGVHVIPLPEKSLYETEFHNWALKVEEDIGSRLTSIADGLSSQGLSFRGLVLRGEPNREIVEFARREGISLIVMGRRGQGLIDRVLTGSTTLRVLRESGTPVLTVKKRDEEAALDIKSILVPVDISERSESALNYAMDLAERIKAGISVVCVFSLYPYDYEIPYWVLEDLIRVSSNELKKRVDKIKLSRGVTDLGIETEVVQGINTATSIVDYASRKKIDLIVINTHGRKGIKRLIIGSVTEKVIQEAPCAVLVLKP